MTWWNRAPLKSFDGILCDGAVRSGKTVCMAVGFFLWSMHRFHGQSFGICGKSIGALRRNIVVHLRSWLGGVVSVSEYRGENKLIVRGANGHVNTFYLFGGQDERAYMQIQGITLAGVFLDEVALMPRSFVEQAVARCSVSGSRLWFNCNPAGPEHWFYREWVTQAGKKNMLHLHFTMEDNPALDVQVRRRYESLYTGVFYRRYILGQWCRAQGLVYAFDPERHVTTLASFAGGSVQRAEFYISVDYGTMNPFSAGLWMVLDGRALRLREFYYNGRAAQRQYTDEEYYDALEKLAGDLPVRQVIVDPSAASFIAVIRRHGRFSVRKAKNAVLPGIRLTASLLQGGALRFTDQCADTIREFGLYRWAEDEQTDTPVKEDDHAMDDIRYFCATVMARKWQSATR